MTYFDAVSMRALHASGERTADLAKLYGVSWSHAKRIVLGQSRSSRTRRFGREKMRGKVAVVRSMLAAGEKPDWIAFELGVSRSAVARIANGSRWGRKVAR